MAAPHSSDPADSSSLDTSETSENSPVSAFLREAPPSTTNLFTPLDEGSYAARFRHNSWHVLRRRIYDGLCRARQSTGRICSFATCGSSSWVQQNKEDPTRLRISASHCHDRLCTPCANLRSWRIEQALLAMIAGKTTTFITLTLAGGKIPLQAKLDKLYRSFKALRNHPLWEDAVRGGAAFLEVKWSDRAQTWHPHLHIVCESGYMPQDQLSKAWHSITRDSYIVDIRKVRDAQKAGGYICKYASKPLNSSFSNTPALLDEAIVALKGRRLCMCFGTWYGTPLDLAEDTELADDLIDAAGWENLFPLEVFLEQAAHGDRESMRIIIALDVEARWRASLQSPT